MNDPQCLLPMHVGRVSPTFLGASLVPSCTITQLWQQPSSEHHLTTALWVGCFYHPHFTDEEAEAQRDEFTHKAAS